MVAHTSGGSAHRHHYMEHFVRSDTLNSQEVKIYHKGIPATRHGCAWGERRYSSYSLLTSAPDGGKWSASRPSRALPPGKGPPVPIGQKAGWVSEPVWTQRLVEKSFDPTGDVTPIARSSSP
jgi:hypothetical protein